MLETSLETGPRCVALAEPSPGAALALAEPGAPGLSELCGSTEHNHVLALGTGEAYATFGERAQQRARALAGRSPGLIQITYLVGTGPASSWPQRQALLAELSCAIDRKGTLIVHAPAHMRLEVFVCLGELQRTTASGITWHFVFRERERRPDSTRTSLRSERTHETRRDL